MLALLGGCATLSVSEERQIALDQAVAADQRGDHEFAARAAMSWLAGGAEDDPGWDSALLLLGRNLERLDLTYAASLYYGEVARARRDPERVPDALRGIARIADSGAIDHQSLIAGFVASAELPQLPKDIQGFVDFHKGLDALRRGDVDWADGRFARVEGAQWKARVRYVRAVRDVAALDLAAAAKHFEALEADPRAPESIRSRSKRSLARLHLSQGRWAEALERYHALREQTPRDAELLLELAWTHYHLGHPRRALGLLLALDAPAHRGLIAPERFLLEAMCLRRLCQYEPARLAAVRLRSRHGAELAELYEGIPPARSVALRATARHRGEAAREAALVDRMRVEQARIDDLEGDFGADLSKRLRLNYSRGLQEAIRRERVVVTDEALRLADELLQAEEGVRLILHELGVAVLRAHGRSSGQVDEPPLRTPNPATHVAYDFVGEFWTDELDALVVRVEDRCID